MAADLQNFSYDLKVDDRNFKAVGRLIQANEKPAEDYSKRETVPAQILEYQHFPVQEKAS